MTQVAEWGLLETPILLTNTLAVGKVSDAAVKWMTRRFPGIGTDYDVIIPLVGECDDSWLNDTVGRHVRSEHVYRAIEQATGGRGAEGAVGAGTGLITCDFKSGIGTSSRLVAMGSSAASGPFNLGVLVQSNFGVMRSLRVDGIRRSLATSGLDVIEIDADREDLTCFSLSSLHMPQAQTSWPAL